MKQVKRKYQSRKGSFIESLTNISLGLIIAISTTQIVSWVGPSLGLDIHVSIESNLALSSILTAISILRSYFVRRAFNKIDRFNEE